MIRDRRQFNDTRHLVAKLLLFIAVHYSFRKNSCPLQLAVVLLIH